MTDIENGIIYSSAAECFKQNLVFLWIFAMKLVWKCSGLFPIRWHRSIFSNVFLMFVELNNRFSIDFVLYIFLFFDAFEMDYLALKIDHFCSKYMNEDQAGQGFFFFFTLQLFNETERIIIKIIIRNERNQNSHTFPSSHHTFWNYLHDAIIFSIIRCEESTCDVATTCEESENKQKNTEETFTGTQTFESNRFIYTFP